MPNFILTSGVHTAPVDLDTGNFAFVGTGALMNNQIRGLDGINAIQINGALFHMVNTPGGGGIVLAGAENSVAIGAQGTVNVLSPSSNGGIGIEMDSTVSSISRLTNAGEITATGIGVFLYQSSQVRNSGTISGGDTGLLCYYIGNHVINNSGLISGFNYGISNVSANYSGSSVSMSIFNTGTIEGGTLAISAGILGDSVINRGLIIGNVALDDGEDSFDNRGGAVEGDVDLGAGADVYSGANGTVNGTVSGGTGADRFIGNANLAEDFDGGADIDTLDFRTLGAAVVALDGSLANAGSAAGDTYIGFENVNGSNAGGDHIVGNAAANVINGLAGDDTLGGGDGADNLRGGTGLDVLTGGLGNDTFRFLTFAEFGDQITDFSSNAPGNNDRFMLTAADLGGGLVAGTLAATRFHSRADNLAQDTDDRFIFRTSDRTLWFDADGTGAGAAVMVADLQPGATMTALDILLI